MWEEIGNLHWNPKSQDDTSVLCSFMVIALFLFSRTVKKIVTINYSQLEASL